MSGVLNALLVMALLLGLVIVVFLYSAYADQKRRH